MKNIIYIIASIILFTSCEDNNDIVLPEDVQNINLEVGITFGVISNNCVTNCITYYNWKDSGVFVGEPTNDLTNPIFMFSECPISEQTRFVSGVDGVPNVPRGLRDVVGDAISEGGHSSGFDESRFFVEYTLLSGQTRAAIFTNNDTQAEDLNEQLKVYYDYIIETVTSLGNLDTTPIPTCM